MTRLQAALLGAACVMASAAVGCTRASESPPPPAPSAGGELGQDVKGVARATEKAAKDLGHATVDLANKAGAGGQDAWITTKVKSALTSDGFDPVHVHVDTDAQVVTLSGTVDSTSDAQKALAAAKAIEGVAGVKDHLFVKPAR